MTDRITLTIGADGAVADAVRTRSLFIAGQTFAVDLTVRRPAEVNAPAQPVGEGGTVKVAITRVDS
jgi:hypothetical protein